MISGSHLKNRIVVQGSVLAEGLRRDKHSGDEFPRVARFPSDLILSVGYSPQAYLRMSRIGNESPTKTFIRLRRVGPKGIIEIASSILPE
jgi:hypothetical protein